MMMIPYGRQHITAEDVEAVVSVLRSDFLTQGPVVPRFESAVAEHVGARHGVAVNSATSALHLACLALGLGPGDLLWTSPITFVASANCARYCGAAVDFVDIDPRTFNLCPDALEQKLLVAERDGRLPKIVIPVHLAGQPCDMDRIYVLARRYGFKIIEDASHAIGAKYKGRWVGESSGSDITIFSFHPVKIITSAEGGIALTNDPDLAHRMELLRSHGITRDPGAMTRASPGSWYYEQLELGFNYRMTELQGALGLSQLARLDSLVAVRHSLALRYDRSLADLPLVAPWQNPVCYSAFHLYVVRVDMCATDLSRDAIFEELRERGIGVNVHYIPVHTQPYYKRLGFSEGDFPEAEAYYREAFSLPLYPGLGEEGQNAVLDALRAVIAS